MRALLGVLARRSLVARLMLTQTLVLVVGLGTATLVDTLVGPPLFHRHLQRGGHTLPVREQEHIEAGFASASLIALVVALATALAVALVVSMYLTRRIQAPLTALVNASGSLASGRVAYVPSSGIGVEFDELTDAYNSMAERLDHVEDTRRRLLSDLAHEMRTPVTTLDGYLEGLDDGIVEWDGETSRTMHDQMARLVRLVEDIDLVSRAEEGRLPLEPAPVTASEILASAEAGVRERSTQRGVALVVEDHTSATDVLSVDPQRVAQVLANLLENALRHTPPGGTVRLAAETSGAVVRVTVDDDGEGIDPRHLPHLFERFYRADTARDREHGGSGIGLTISRAIARAHGGELSASSPGVGGGAEFRLELPLR